MSKNLEGNQSSRFFSGRPRILYWVLEMSLRETWFFLLSYATGSSQLKSALHNSHIACLSCTSCRCTCQNLLICCKDNCLKNENRHFPRRLQFDLIKKGNFFRKNKWTSHRRRKSRISFCKSIFWKKLISTYFLILRNFLDMAKN
jgi:hypothetical protein